MALLNSNRIPTIIRYVTTALLISLPGIFFSAKAISIYLYRQRKLDIGIGMFDVPGFPGMPIDAYIRWMFVFSVPFFVFSAFVLYRLFIRLNHGGARMTNGQ